MMASLMEVSFTDLDISCISDPTDSQETPKNFKRTCSNLLEISPNYWSGPTTSTPIMKTNCPNSSFAQNDSHSESFMLTEACSSVLKSYEERSISEEDGVKLNFAFLAEETMQNEPLSSNNLFGRSDEQQEHLGMPSLEGTTLLPLELKSTDHSHWLVHSRAPIKSKIPVKIVTSKPASTRLEKKDGFSTGKQVNFPKPKNKGLRKTCTVTRTGSYGSYQNQDMKVQNGLKGKIPKPQGLKNLNY